MRYKSDIEVDHVIYEQIKQDMSSYFNKILHDDGTVTVRQVNSSYFLLNDQWRIYKLNAISQFQGMIKEFMSERSRKTIYFDFNSETLNLEVKYIFFKRLFNHNWKISTVFQSLQHPLKKLTEFINEEYSTLSSFKQLKIDKAEQEYISWLNEHGIKTKRIKKSPFYNDVEFNTSAVAILRILYNDFNDFANQQEEWRKDIWDVRKLNKFYGIKHNQTSADYYLTFTKVKQESMRNDLKMFFRQRLISKHKFAWSTSLNYMNVLSKFLNMMLDLEPHWKNLNHLKRHHIESYIHYLHVHANQLNNKRANPENYVATSLRVLRKFLKDIQKYQYDYAPLQDASLLIFTEDIPGTKTKSISQVDYIPDFVLKQLFKHIGDLDYDIQAIVWIMYKTGLRISDILTLTSKCLIHLNGQYWIETDIKKNFVKGHRMPIDEQLGELLLELIKRANQSGDLSGLLFFRSQGPRQGQPLDKAFVRLSLNKFALRNHIIDESGHVYHFTLHQFRHTYAMKLLNGGMDIFTVQELLGHASFSMTMRYAKLLDQTKREIFNSVVNQGVFDIK